MSQQTPTIGQLITGEAYRDAIHIAVAPVIAGMWLNPGDHVLLDTNGKAQHTTIQKSIGIVDPFLQNRVKTDQRFYLFLHPNTVSSLRHSWTHPAFEKLNYQSPPLTTNPTSSNEFKQTQKKFLQSLDKDPYDHDTRKVYADFLEEHQLLEQAYKQRSWTPQQQQAIEWLHNFAKECRLEYNTLLDAANEWLEFGEYLTLPFDTPSSIYPNITEFWKKFSLATGKEIDPRKQKNFIGCSC